MPKEVRGARPPLEADDMAAWSFYCRNATPFIEKYGLMGSRLAEYGLSGVAKDIFIDRLSTIHEAICEMMVREVERLASQPRDTIVAEDPT